MKKRIITLFLALSIISACTACQSGNTGSMAESGTSQTESNEKIQLKNLMTDTELNSISVGKLSLLEDEDETTEPADGEHIVQIEIWTNDDYRKWYEENKEQFSEEEYSRIMSMVDTEEIKSIHGVLIDGRYYTGFLPPYDYNGGLISYSATSSDSEEPETVEFENLDELKVWYKDYLDNQVKNGEITKECAEQTYSDMLIIFQSVIDKNYEILEEPIGNFISENNFKDKWEFDPDEAAEISDNVTEISMYDQELDSEFIIHVTTPPGFDKSKSCPVFVMTDGVWRFGNHYALWKMMKDGRSEDVILVSIGYDFSLDGTDNSVRAKYFCENKDKFLDFISDNLMPYLSGNYNIDFNRSSLYGHSLGGVFTHYAAFNSDLYENQPFQNYIIGSPAFWSPYFLTTEKNPDAFRSEYGYFDRQKAFEKNLYICGGENEDADYAEYYGENDTTLEGIENMMKRFESCGITSAECKIYEGTNHYEYIPAMFKEYFLKFYGK